MRKIAIVCLAAFSCAASEPLPKNAGFEKPDAKGGADGWTLYNERTGVEMSGGGNSVDIAFEENDEYVLTWKVVTNYVKVTVNMFPDRMARVGASVTPGTGWYPYGQYTTFTANAPEGYTLESWNGSGAAGLPEDAYRSSTSVSFAPVAPISITARFATGGASDEDPEVTTYALTTSSYGITDEGIEELSGAIPASAVQGGGEASGTTLADGGSVELNTSPVVEPEGGSENASLDFEVFRFSVENSVENVEKISDFLRLCLNSKEKDLVHI